MVPWQLEFSEAADKDLASLDGPVRRRIIDKLNWLIQSFEIVLSLPLSGDHKNFYKLRVGDWRVIYKIEWNSKKVVVEYIDRRDKVYKKKRR